MTDAEKIIWGIAATLTAAFVAGTTKLILKRRADRLKLTADLSVYGDVHIISLIGCAGLLLTVISRGTRQAKIKSAWISLENADVLSAFQKGFGSDFGHTPVPGHDRQTMVVDFLPISPAQAPDGYVLSRDDVVKFALPIQLPGFPLFADAPSENVTIGVTLFDDSEITLLRGIVIQNAVRTLISLWGNARQALNFPLNIRIKTVSATLPDAPHLVGKTNPNAVSLCKPPTNQNNPSSG